MEGYQPEFGKPFAELLHVSGFTLGKKEKLNGRVAQIIEYELKFSGFNDSVAVVVWVDTKTNLPLKRMESDKKDGKLDYTETYTKLTLGGKIDEKKFELPK